MCSVGCFSVFTDVVSERLAEQRTWTKAYLFDKMTMTKISTTSLKWNSVVRICLTTEYHKYHYSKQGISWSLIHFCGGMLQHVYHLCRLWLHFHKLKRAAPADITAHTCSWWFICYLCSSNSRLVLFCIVLCTCFSSTWAICAVMSSIWIMRCSQFHSSTWYLGRLTQSLYELSNTLKTD